MPDRAGPWAVGGLGIKAAIGEFAMGLLAIAIFGLIVPNGYFIYWLLHDFDGLGPVFDNRLAIGFILDAFITLGILAVHFAYHPPGRYRWTWFVAFSIAGGLCFGLPFYWWLNRRGRSTAASR